MRRCVLTVVLLPLLAACGDAKTGPEALNDPAVLGAQVYRSTCQTCHGPEGKGAPGAFPPLTGNRVKGNPAPLVRIVLHGLRGPLVVNGQRYDGVMTPHGAILSDDQIAAVLTYVRSHFGNDAPAVSPDTVAAIRATTQDRTSLYTADELAR
ncbi:MAG TPA: cytochrome c [Rhodothermales bacterium]|nr:cytochrome c [Rhodothermales bacterium]